MTLRDDIARTLSIVETFTGTNVADYFVDADAILALPEIARALDLADVCGGLTVEQVKRALFVAKHYTAALVLDASELATPNDKAIANWKPRGER